MTRGKFMAARNDCQTPCLFWLISEFIVVQHVQVEIRVRFFGGKSPNPDS